MQFWKPFQIAEMVVEQVGKTIGKRKVIWPQQWRTAITDAVTQDRQVILASDRELLSVVAAALAVLIAEVKSTNVEVTPEFLQDRATKLLDAMRKIRGLDDGTGTS